MEPFTMTLLAMAAQAALAKGMQEATPKYGMTDPSLPQNQPQMMDFQALLDQGNQSQLPQMQLRNRLPQSQY